MPKVPAARRSQEPSATAACLPGPCLGSVPDIPTPRSSGEGHRDSRASGEKYRQGQAKAGRGNRSTICVGRAGRRGKSLGDAEREGEKGTQRGHLRRRR